MQARVEEMASGYEEPEEYVNWHLSDPERSQKIESMMMEERVVEAMLEDRQRLKMRKHHLADFMNA